MTANNARAREALESLRELRRARSRWSKKRLNHGGRAARWSCLWIASRSLQADEGSNVTHFPRLDERGARVRVAFVEASQREVNNVRQARMVRRKRGAKARSFEGAGKK